MKYVLIELIGKCRKSPSQSAFAGASCVVPDSLLVFTPTGKQHAETGWFVCVDHVEVRGYPLLRAGPAPSPPALPDACRHATVLRPVKRRVEVLGYSQERTLYRTVDAGQGGVSFRPESAPKPQNVSPDDLEFSPEGEAARGVTTQATLQLLAMLDVFLINCLCCPGGRRVAREGCACVGGAESSRRRRVWQRGV